MAKKKILKPLAKLLLGKEAARRRLHEPAPREQLHAFWRAPDAENQPQGYLNAGPARTAFLLSILTRHLPTSGNVLEIGCNAGRNLKGLHGAGYRRLHAIEINPAAVQLFRESLPDVAACTTVHNQPVEDVIRTFPDRTFEGIFSMAVLEHIHTDSDWIFAEIARLTGQVLLTIEDERGVAFANVPRDYRKVFEPLGLVQVECLDATDIEGLGPGFQARVFKRPPTR